MQAYGIAIRHETNDFATGTAKKTRTTRTAATADASAASSQTAALLQETGAEPADAGSAAALAGGAIAGIVVGVMAALVLWLRRSKKGKHYELDHCLQPTYVDAPGNGKDVATALPRKAEPQELGTDGDYARDAVYEMPADAVRSGNA